MAQVKKSRRVNGGLETLRRHGVAHFSRIAKKMQRIKRLKKQNATNNRRKIG